ncbi:MAG: glycosyltransferase family 4 protein [Candidatus Heimdallarchaeaceae archaeon]
MKIAFIIPTSLMEWGGVENYIFEIANLLSRSHHVMVFSNGIINNRRITKLLPHSFYYEELPTISINFMKPSLAVPRLPKWINHYEFAYIYHVGVMYSYLALRYLKIPKVLGIHSDILSNFSQWRYPRKVSLGAFKILFKYANGIRCGTNHYVRLLKNSLGINPKKIFVIPEHVNTDVFAPCQKKKHFTVLFAGRLTKDKGIEIILDLVNRLKECDVNWLFLGSGEKKYEAMLEKVSKKKPNVIWKGFVPIYELAEELAKASLTVVPSKGGEGYSNIALQSLACGTPVLLSRIPVFYELASKLPKGVCSLFQPDNSCELLNKILMWKSLIETNEEHYREICAQARSYIEKYFSLHSSQRRFESMIDKVISHYKY